MHCVVEIAGTGIDSAKPFQSKKTDLVIQLYGLRVFRRCIGRTGMVFARVQGWLLSRRLVLTLAAAQLVLPGAAWAQNPATVTTMTIAPSTGQESSIARGTVVTLT